MNIAILYPIFASFLYAITNHIDKFLVDDRNENSSNIKTLLVFSTFVAGLVLSPIWLFLSRLSVGISLIPFISIFVSSIMYIIGIYTYYKALEENDASTIVAMYQLIPVFVYILALILFNESFNIKQIIGSLVIILSAAGITVDFKEKSNKKKTKALLLMFLSSFFIAVYYILFAFAIKNYSFYSCAFWYQIGLLLIGIIFLLIKPFRNSFIISINNNGKKYLILNILNEAINLVGVLLSNYAVTMIPVALADVLGGFQGTFVFTTGLIGTIFFPKYFKEDLDKKAVIQKVICIILGLIGLIILVM